MEQASSACRVPVLWPDSNSWIDLTRVRESLLNCVSPTTGIVDTVALARVEFEHNRCVVADVLKIVPVGSDIGIVKRYWSEPEQRDCVDGGTIYLKCRACDRFGLARGGPGSWTLQEAADAIAAVSLDIHIDACARGYYYGDPQKMGHVGERSWIRAATAALADGPGQDSWTAHAIDAMGAALRTLVPLCDDRAHNRHHAPLDHLCSPQTLRLATALASAFDQRALGAAYGKDWARVIDTERSLRGMLAWIDAMERTDVIFEHMLKRYQAERIDRAIAADSHFVSPFTEVTQSPLGQEDK